MFARSSAVRAVRNLLCIGVALGSARPAFAIERETVTGGADAAITDGTVVATAESGAAIWFNPAALTSVKDGAFDLSGSVYTARLGKTENRMVLESGEKASGSEFNFRAVPRAISFAANIGSRIVLAGGVFNSVLIDSTHRADVLADDKSVAWSMASSQRAAALHFATALGWKVSDKLSIGWALDAVYLDSLTTLVLAGQTDPPQSPGAPYETAEHASWFSGGPQARMGVRYTPSSRWSLGAMVGSPTLGVFYSEDVLKTHAGPGNGREVTPTKTGLTQNSGGTAQQLEPGRVRVGIARTDGPRWIALDGDLRFPMQGGLNEDRPFGASIRLGGLAPVKARSRMGGALIYSRDHNNAEPRFGSVDFDYFGGTFGADISNRVVERITRARFSIAFAFGYVVGVGRASVLRLPRDPYVDVPTLTTTRSYQHDLSLNIAAKIER